MIINTKGRALITKIQVFQKLSLQKKTNKKEVRKSNKLYRFEFTRANGTAQPLPSPQRSSIRQNAL